MDEQCADLAEVKGTEGENVIGGYINTRSSNGKNRPVAKDRKKQT